MTPPITPAWERLLEVSALVLGIVNGLMLLRLYLRDRAKLRVEPVHPDVYQWWIRLPPGENGGKPTRRFVFLCYVGIANSGLRNVTMDSWRLHLRTQGGKNTELRALSIPEPERSFSGGTKAWPVLGVRGLHYSGETIVASGGSITGFAYYLYECYGHESWNPRMDNERIHARFYVTSVFGQRASCEISFRELRLDEAKSMVSEIDRIGVDSFLEEPPTD